MGRSVALRTYAVGYKIASEVAATAIGVCCPWTLVGFRLTGVLPFSRNNIIEPVVLLTVLVL